MLLNRYLLGTYILGNFHRGTQQYMLPYPAFGLRSFRHAEKCFVCQTPSVMESKVMVMRASVTVLFTRSVTSGDGGESVEDTVHLSLVKVETLVDQPSMGDEGGRKVHQVTDEARFFLVCFLVFL